MRDLSEAQVRTLKKLGSTPPEERAASRTGGGGTVLGTVAAALYRMGLATWRTTPTSRTYAVRVYKLTDAGKKVLSELE